MKTFFVRLVVLAALAALTSASKLIAQGPQLAVLNEADVRQLIVRGEPADHSRLSAHFTSLAQRYAADAKRHESMGQAFSGNTKLAHIATSQREHCRQLSARNLESASTLRELAAHHAKQAAGVPSDPPKGSERFERGAGAPVLSDAELTRLAATAETPADHRALEGYFTTLAGRYEQEAKESTTYAASWRSLSSKNPLPPVWPRTGTDSPANSERLPPRRALPRPCTKTRQRPPGSAAKRNRAGFRMPARR